MLVRDKNLGYLLRLVAQLGKGLHIILHFLAHIEWRAQFLLRCLKVVLESSVDQNHLVASVNQKVLQTAAVDNLLVGTFLTFTAKGKLLVHKTAIEHANCFNLHNRTCFVWVSNKSSQI